MFQKEFLLFAHKYFQYSCSTKKMILSRPQFFLKAELRASAEPADYNNEAIRIIDARNHLFQNVGRCGTDEECGIYAIRDLCHVDEDTLETVPDRMRLAALAHALGLQGK